MSFRNQTLLGVSEVTSSRTQEVHEEEGSAQNGKKIKIHTKEITTALHAKDVESLKGLFRTKSFSHIMPDLLCSVVEFLFLHQAHSEALYVMAAMKTPRKMIHSIFLPIAQFYKTHDIGELHAVDKKTATSFLQLIDTNILPAALESSELHIVGDFIEFGLGLSQYALPWHIRSAEIGGIDSILALARIYLVSGETEQGVNLLERYFELPFVNTGYTEESLHIACTQREPAAKMLLEHYTETNQVGDLLRIWFELRTRTLLLPEKKLLSASLFIQDHSLDSTGNILSSGKQGIMSSLQILEYNAQIDEILGTPEHTLVDFSESTLRNIISAACLLRHVNARKFLITFVHSSLLGDKKDIGRLIDLIDRSMPDALVDAENDNYIGEWEQVDSDNPLVPKKAIHLRKRVITIFYSLLEDCIFDTDLPNIHMMLESIEALFPAYIGKHAAFSDTPITIYETLIEKKAALEIRKNRREALSENAQQYIATMRAEIDEQFDTQISTLAYFSYAHLEQHLLPPRYKLWLLSELYIGHEYDTLISLLGEVSNAEFLEICQEDEIGGHIPFLFELFGNDPELLLEILDIRMLPSVFWEKSENLAVYFRYLSCLKDDHFLQEFAQFENEHIARNPNSGLQLMSEMFPGITKKDEESILSGVSRARSLHMESDVFLLSEAYIVTKGEQAAHAKDDTYLRELQHDLAPLLHLYNQENVFDTPLSLRQWNQTLPYTWLDQPVSQAVYASIQKYYAWYCTLSEEKYGSLSNEMKDLVNLTALYLAYGHKNHIDASQEIGNKLDARRFLSNKLSQGDSIYFLHDYWDLLLLQFEGGLGSFPLSSPWIQEYLADMYNISASLQELLLAEAHTLVSRGALEARHGDILAPLFARLSKIFILWFHDTENSEYFSRYAHLYDPGVYTFGDDIQTDSYVFPIASRIQ